MVLTDPTPRRVAFPLAAAATAGKLKWYFQTVHHELWDFDLPPEPVLMDVMHGGKKVPELVQTGKIGYVFVFDRVTGKPVFPVQERPVPKGDAPGEQYSPTQPFPVKPPPVARVTITRDDIVTADDTTPEHAKACHSCGTRVISSRKAPIRLGSSTTLQQTPS